MARTARKTAAPAPTVEQLQLAVNRVKEDARQATVAALTAPPASTLIPPSEPTEPFARWLIGQAPLKRSGLIGMLAAAAKGDPRFPKSADPEGVRNHVSKLGADGDIFEAIDDAEREWSRG